MKNLSHRLLFPGLAAAAALLGSTVTAQHRIDSVTGVSGVTAVNGADAVAVLAGRMTAVAREHGLTADDLAALLLSDSTLWLDDNDRLVYVDTAVPAVEHDPPDEPAALAGEISVDDAFLLETDPGADRTIYLDFDGHHSVNNAWGHDIEFPPYSVDGNEAFFFSELEEIIAIWRYVAEDFAPFDVNVTTKDPGLDALTRSSGSDPTYGVRCVMTQATDGFGDGIGGVAFLHSFDDSVDNPVFAFNKGTNNGSMTASHEVGHALGLSHDGLGGQTYHPGTGEGLTSWGPIMGAPFNKSLVQWSNGDYPNATNGQNDLAIILNHVSSRPDLHGDTGALATPFGPGCSPSADGIIGAPTDVDVFRFTTVATTVTVVAAPPASGANLDIQVTIYDDEGVFVTAGNSPDALQGVVTIPLGAGQYVAEVDGVGLPGIYTDYGCLGQYTITFLPAVCPCAADLDEDGAVGILDFLQLLGAWGPCFGCPEDLNGDFEVGITDFLDLLAAWGPCP